ncbi:oxidoreductase [Vagococcus penaei]|uniref:Oxidoreductase n=1 Tax=Vagococcus penaei TaxID=633807 RepID=A0A1Q2D486_9ENTE|nr:Gfo/Idh/MocA family oxidoreductase [Vagococcus penaei]AQP53121.1 oxidoreductase [Vagococcus penaei]RSU06017.1 oxidoreductase [Vagococcus penaei]
MLNLGIIGTNWITHEFVEAALKSEEYQLTAVYSRHEAKARRFADHYSNAGELLLFTDLEAFFQSSEIDVVYIASPNSLHYEQAKKAMEAGKNVIVEKPIASNSRELKELINLSEDKEVFMFEAARHLHEVNFQTVKKLLAEDKSKIIGANLTFMKYSSRYDAYLEGTNPNIFSATYSGGALMDLGVYLIYAAVDWFGRPDEVVYFDRKLDTGVDVMGTLIFRYPTFDVTMMTGKHANSYLPSEIYLTDGTIRLDAVNSIEEILYEKRKSDGTVEHSLAVQPEENPMIDEARAFSQIITHPYGVKEQKRYQDWIGLCREVHEIMTTIREQNDIVFEADK